MVAVRIMYLSTFTGMQMHTIILPGVVDLTTGKYIAWEGRYRVWTLMEFGNL
jgi:hypothetical protein